MIYCRHSLFCPFICLSVSLCFHCFLFPYLSITSLLWLTLFILEDSWKETDFCLSVKLSWKKIWCLQAGTKFIHRGSLNIIFYRTEYQEKCAYKEECGPIDYKTGTTIKNIEKKHFFCIFLIPFSITFPLEISWGHQYVYARLQCEISIQKLNSSWSNLYSTGGTSMLNLQALLINGGHIMFKNGHRVFFITTKVFNNSCQAN